MEKKRLMHPARFVQAQGILFCSRSLYFTLLHTLYAGFPVGLVMVYLPFWPALLWLGLLVGVSTGYCYRLCVSHCIRFKYKHLRCRILLCALCIGLLYGVAGVLCLMYLPVAAHCVFIAVLAMALALGAITFCVDWLTFAVYLGVAFTPVLLFSFTSHMLLSELALGAMACVFVCSIFTGHSQLLRTAIEMQLASENRAKRLALSNRKLMRLSTQDPLTLLANRRLFGITLQREWRRAVRVGGALSVMMLDVDFFKQYNDHYGHLQADECLRKIACVLLNETHRPADLAARFGGDEFCAVIPDTPVNGALHFVNRVYHGIARLRMPHHLSPHGYVSVSMGVVTVLPRHSFTCEDLLHAADSALYRAKANGRNRIHVGGIDW